MTKRKSSKTDSEDEMFKEQLPWWQKLKKQEPGHIPAYIAKVFKKEAAKDQSSGFNYMDNVVARAPHEIMLG
jgi:hypothetical protein